MRILHNPNRDTTQRILVKIADTKTRNMTGFFACVFGLNFAKESLIALPCIFRSAKALPGGMFGGGSIQEYDIYSIRSMRRNPVIADLFHRMKYMERRGSGLRKIVSETEDRKSVV